MQANLERKAEASCNGGRRENPESHARLHADVSGNRLPPEKRDFRWAKNNFRGHDISRPMP